MATQATSQSALYKAYVKRCKREGREPLEFGQWNWRAKNLAKARKAKGATVASAPAKPVSKSKTTERVDDGFVRTNGRVNRRVDLAMSNGIACMTVDKTDLNVALKALRGYKATHAQGEGYVSKRGAREKLYMGADNLTNARKALVSAGLQPAF